MCRPSSSGAARCTTSTTCPSSWRACPPTTQDSGSRCGASRFAAARLLVLVFPVCLCAVVQSCCLLGFLDEESFRLGRSDLCASCLEVLPVVCFSTIFALSKALEGGAFSYRAWCQSCKTFSEFLNFLRVSLSTFSSWSLCWLVLHHLPASISGQSIGAFFSLTTHLSCPWLPLREPEAISESESRHNLAAPQAFSRASHKQPVRPIGPAFLGCLSDALTTILTPQAHSLCAGEGPEGAQDCGRAQDAQGPAQADQRRGREGAHPGGPRPRRLQVHPACKQSPWQTLTTFLSFVRDGSRLLL